MCDFNSLAICARPFVTLLSGADITDKQFCTVPNILPNLFFLNLFWEKEKISWLEFISYGGQGRMG